MTSPETLAYQQSFAKTHSEFVEAARGVISQTAAEVFADATGPALNEPHVMMCRSLAQTVLNSFYAATLLTEHGCGPDALKIVRSMFETSVILASFDHFPELIKDFMDFRWIKKWKLINAAKGTFREKFISPELEGEIKKNYDLVISRFADKNGKPLSSWFRGSFKDLCAKLDNDSAKVPWAIVHYSDLYTMSSSLMHCDIMGLESQVDPTGYYVETPPSDQYITESLISSHWAMFWALASYASIAKLPKAQEYGDRLLKSYEQVWGEGSRELKQLQAPSPSLEADTNHASVTDQK